MGTMVHGGIGALGKFWGMLARGCIGMHDGIRAEAHRCDEGRATIQSKRTKEQHDHPPLQGTYCRRSPWTGRARPRPESAVPASPCCMQTGKKRKKNRANIKKKETKKEKKKTRRKGRKKKEEQEEEEDRKKERKLNQRAGNM